MVRPLVITPLAGAAGGVWYFLMDYLRYQGGWKTMVAYALSFIGLFIALWVGIVLGLVGTMWH
jgi:membrane associated rhomboid family serine protease